MIMQLGYRDRNAGFITPLAAYLSNDNFLMGNCTMINMLNKKYASLTAIKPTKKKSTGRNIIWVFICDCGNKCELDGYMVRSGKRVTCQKCSKERVRLASIKHGLSKTVEFRTWADIQARCYNKKSTSYNNYGGRGIAVCDRWLKSFNNFLKDMGKRPSNKHSIERKDNNSDYCPDNCHWATMAEQSNNKRNNRKITINGITKNMNQWASDHGLTSSIIFYRLKAGLTGCALIAPSKRLGTVTFNGETNTYAGWSKKTGIKSSTIAMRITKYKWPIEKALTKGAIF